MLRAALVTYLVGGLALGIGTWELLFQLLAYALVANRLARGCLKASAFFTVASSHVLGSGS